MLFVPMNSSPILFIGFLSHLKTKVPFLYFLLFFILSTQSFSFSCIDGGESPSIESSYSYAGRPIRVVGVSLCASYTLWVSTVAPTPPMLVGSSVDVMRQVYGTYCETSLFCGGVCGGLGRVSCLHYIK